MRGMSLCYELHPPTMQLAQKKEKKRKAIYFLFSKRGGSGGRKMGTGKKKKRAGNQLQTLLLPHVYRKHDK